MQVHIIIIIIILDAEYMQNIIIKFYLKTLEIGNIKCIIKCHV